MTKEVESDPIRKTDNFITKRSKSPLWVFGWGLFLTSLTFIAGVFLDLNEQNANIAKFNSLAHTYEMDARKTAGISRTLSIVLDASIAALSYFAENIQSKNDPAAISNDVLEKQLALIAEARGAVNAELSVFSSLHFNDAGFSPFVQGFESDLEALDDILAAKELICQKLRNKKYDEARVELDKLKQRDYKKDRQLDAASIRMTAFESATKLKEEEYAAELQLQKARLTSFRIKVYLLLPVSGIVGLFAVIVIRSFKGSVARGSKDSPSPLKHSENDRE